MKKLKSLIFTLCISIGLFAQAPQSINYQAIAWNANNTPRTNQTITVTFNIRALTTTGSIEFTETHTTATNEQGLFTLGIGSANQNGFKAIDWSKGPKFMQVIVDGLPAGTTQILSVPYALYAEKTNLQAGAGVSVSGNTITNTGDLDNTNEIQALTITGNQLTLSKNGGTVLIPSSGSAGPTYSAGSGISISPTNIISADLKAGEGIAINGNTISSTNTGGGGTGTTYTAGTGISITGNTISVNEQQALSLVGSKLSLSPNGGSVDLPSGDKQILNYADGVLSISNGNSVSLPGVDYLTINATSFHAGTSSNSFFDVEKIDRLIVPNSGIYMVFFSAWIIGLNPAQSEATLQVATATKFGSLLHVVTGGQTRGSGVGVWIAQLDKGEQLRMRCEISGISSFRIDEHWMTLVRIR